MKKKSLYLIPYALSLSLFFFSSCDSNRVFEDNTDIPDFTWDVKNKISFDVDIPDTSSMYNLYVNVRNASHYPYANIFIFATITFPNGKTRSDTIECVLADESGQWKGDGAGDIWDNQIPWMEKIKFPLSGKYKFEYEHAMRLEQVPFIMDVGLRVEKVKKKK